MKPFTFTNASRVSVGKLLLQFANFINSNNLKSCLDEERSFCCTASKITEDFFFFKGAWQMVYFVIHQLRILNLGSGITIATHYH